MKIEFKFLIQNDILYSASCSVQALLLVKFTLQVLVPVL